MYLRNIVANFLTGRSYFFARGDGSVISHLVTREIPHGSILSLFLWNISYDDILQSYLPYGAKLLGYADDTLILVSGNSMEALKHRAEQVSAHIIALIDSLGLSVAYNKTEALLFSGQNRNRLQGQISINIRGMEILSTPIMKYLGVYQHKKWRFKEHIVRVSNKADKVLVALFRIMPNIGGPREVRRKLFTTAVHSILLYGAPIWAQEKVLKVRSRILPFIQVQHCLNQKSVCAYRTVSGTAAGLIASSPPIELLARTYRRRYDRFWDIRHIRPNYSI